MKKIFLFFLFLYSVQKADAANGDSVFSNQQVHTLYITFPYPAFYDSLLSTKTTDIYLQVNIVFDGVQVDNVGIKVKGNSSFNNPSQKKSFKLDFNEFVSGQKLDGLKKVNFNNAFKDPSFVREKLSNDFLIAHQCPAPRTAYCNVYMNNQLWGLYTVVEQVDGDFTKRWFGNDEGNLFKGDPHGDLVWKGAATQALYEPEYELKNNEVAHDWSDLIALINTINNTPDNQLQAELDSRLNTTVFMKQWAAMNIFSSLDAYIGSGHNYYIYNNQSTNTFEWIAWDQNEVFGSFKMNLSENQLKDMDMYYISNANSRPLCNKMLLNATYKTLYNNAYCGLLNDFSNSTWDAHIDSLRNLIQQSVYSDPKKFYTNTKFDSSFNYDLQLQGPGGMTVFGIKNFIATRRSNLLNNLQSHGVTCNPASLSDVERNAGIVLYPNPAGETILITSDKEFSDLILYDMQGRILNRYELNPTQKHTVNINGLSPGMYILRTGNGEKVRFVKN